MAISARWGGAETVRSTLSEDEAAEERRLWADFYEALARILEIMRREGTAGAALMRIVEADAIAGRAMTRIKEIRRIKGASRQTSIKDGRSA